MNLSFKNMKTALVSLSTAAMLSVSVSGQAALLNVQQIEIRNALGTYLQVNQLGITKVGEIANKNSEINLGSGASVTSTDGRSVTNALSNAETYFFGASGTGHTILKISWENTVNLNSFSLRSRYNSVLNYRDVYNVVFKDKSGNVLHELKNWDGRVAKSDILRQNKGLLTANFTANNTTEVPIPAAALLFAPALLGFIGLRRKAKASV